MHTATRRATAAALVILGTAPAFVAAQAISRQPVTPDPPQASPDPQPGVPMVPMMFKAADGRCLAAMPRVTGFSAPQIARGSQIALGPCGASNSKWIAVKGVLMVASTIKSEKLCLSEIKAPAVGGVVSGVTGLFLADCKGVVEQQFVVMTRGKTSALVAVAGKRCVQANAMPMTNASLLTLVPCSAAPAQAWAVPASM